MSSEPTVRVSLGLSCGCRQRSNNIPMPGGEVTWPGKVVICDYHDDYAMILRVTSYLAISRDDVIRRFMTAGMDQTTAEALAADVRRISDDDAAATRRGH